MADPEGLCVATDGSSKLVRLDFWKFVSLKSSHRSFRLVKSIRSFLHCSGRAWRFGARTSCWSDARTTWYRWETWRQFCWEMLSLLLLLENMNFHRAQSRISDVNWHGTNWVSFCLINARSKCQGLSAARSGRHTSHEWSWCRFILTSMPLESLDAFVWAD